jgi:hypothetical protein
VAEDIEATIAGYMAEGLRERLLSAAICKCADCVHQLHVFNAWCFDFTEAKNEAPEAAGEWFNDWAQNPTQYTFRRVK